MTLCPIASGSQRGAEETLGFAARTNKVSQGRQGPANHAMWQCCMREGSQQLVGGLSGLPGAGIGQINQVPLVALVELLARWLAMA